MSSSSANTTRSIQSSVGGKIWLPELVYEALPYLYILGGFSALFTSLYISEWYWIVPHCTLITALLTHAGFSILIKRGKARALKPSRIEPQT